MNYYVFVNIIIVFVFGIFWGLVELLLRYKEWKYIFSQKNERKCFLLGRKKHSENKDNKNYSKDNGKNYVILYIVLNGIVSVIALFLIYLFREETINKINDIDIKNIIIAGFGGMMILRSSIFSIKHNNKDIDVGFAEVVQRLLNIIDEKIKQTIASRRVCDIHEIMKDIDFEKAKDELPVLCIEFIDNFTDEDAENLIEKIKEIKEDFNNINKSLQLGREISKYCGTEILRRVIRKLPHINIQTPKGDSIEKDEIEQIQDKLMENLNSK